jgi:anti-sigma-K factor RskA
MSAEPDTDPDDLLAAEYVLGVLDLAHRAKASEKAKRDPNFAAKITAWENRLSDLNDDYDPIPATNLLPQIEARLFGKSRRISWSWLDNPLGQSVLAAISVVVLAIMLQWGPASVMTTTLTAEASPVRYLARVEGDSLTLQRTAGGPAPNGHSYELWIIIDGQEPLSLGLLGETLSLPAPDAELGYVLAVTTEPEGGAPGGIPTGDIVAAGQFEKI